MPPPTGKFTLPNPPTTIAQRLAQQAEVNQSAPSKPSVQSQIKLPTAPKSIVTGKPLLRIKGTKVIFRRVGSTNEGSTDSLVEGVIRDYDEATRTVVVEAGSSTVSGVSTENSADLITVWTGPIDVLSADDIVAVRQPDALSVLFCLQQRFFSKLPYTWLSRDSLIYVNPFQKCPDVWGGGQPHPFSVAEQARRIISEDCVDVATVITGQSGSGKTEAAKMILRQFASSILQRQKQQDQRKQQLLLLNVQSSSSSSSPSSSSPTTATKTTTRLDLDFVSLISAVNPILESFGNAVTAANPNSSRFIRTTRITTDRKASRPIAAEIQVSLLETARLCGLRPAESSFHIFYAMLAGLSAAEKQDLGLTDATLFRCLVAGLSDANAARQIQQAPGQWLVAAPPHKLHDIVSAMKAVHMTDADTQLTFRMLAFILHLLNIEFAGDQSTSKISSAGSKKSLATAARLLKIDPPSRLEEALTTIKFTDPTTHNSILRPVGLSTAVAARDTTARNLYFSLFLWIVGKINETLKETCDSFSSSASPSASPSPSPAASPLNANAAATAAAGGSSFDSLITEKYSLLILDVFGFESMRNVQGSEGVAPPALSDLNCHNGLEQLLINFVNEELQHLFTENSLIGFCDELSREGITLNSSSSSSSSSSGKVDANAAAAAGGGGSSESNISPAEQMARDLATAQSKTMECLSRKTGGILSTINDDSTLAHPALPAVLQDRVLSLAAKNPTVLKKLRGVPDPSHPSFVVEHFACPVPYSTNGMSSKNKVSSAGLSTLLALVPSSSLEIVELLRSAERASKRGLGSSGTFTKLLREQFDVVLSTLKQSRCLWVRCIKPNSRNTPNTFDVKDVKRQLQTAGVLASANVLAQGLSVRLPIRDFALRFAITLDKYPWKDLEKVQFKKICEAIAKKLQITMAASSASSPGGASSSPSHKKALPHQLHSSSALVQASGPPPMQVGLTKVFLNSDAYEELTQSANSRSSGFVALIQKAGRGFSARHEVGDVLKQAIRRRIAHELALRIEHERPEREVLEIERCAQEERSAMILTSAHRDAANFQQNSKTLVTGATKTFINTMQDELQRVCVDLALYDRLRHQKEKELKEQKHYQEELVRHEEEKQARNVRAAAMAKFRKTPADARVTSQVKQQEEKKRLEREKKEQRMQEMIRWAQDDRSKARIEAEAQLQRESAKGHATRQVQWLHQHLRRSWHRLDTQMQVETNRAQHRDAVPQYVEEDDRRSRQRSESSRRSESIISPAPWDA